MFMCVVGIYFVLVLGWLLVKYIGFCVGEYVCIFV